MDTSIKKKEDSRIEFRVSQEDKDFFEYASQLRGFNSFSDFIRVTLNKEAKAIIEEEKQILSSERDKQIFFKALMGEEAEPNEALISAIQHYNKVSE